MLVRDIMTRHVETIGAEDTLQAAALAMRSHDVGALPVSEHERLVGVITDRDIVVRGVADGLDPALARVRDAMTPQVIYCLEDQSVELAAEEMEERSVRRLVVLDSNKRLVGMLTADDLALHARGLAVDVIERCREPGGRLARGRWLPIG